MAAPSDPTPPQRILFFDGECTLCNGVVDTMIQADRDRRFRYASLQGQTAARWREQVEDFPDDLETFVFLRDGEALVRSAAAFAVARELPWPWRGIALFRVFPRFLTDALYRLIARNRIRWFGRRDSCRVPGPAERDLLMP